VVVQGSLVVAKRKTTLVEDIAGYHFVPTSTIIRLLDELVASIPLAARPMVEANCSQCMAGHLPLLVVAFMLLVQSFVLFLLYPRRYHPLWLLYHGDLPAFMVVMHMALLVRSVVCRSIPLPWPTYGFP
jgi:hypothetical protein